jgi:hypothetical protein
MNTRLIVFIVIGFVSAVKTNAQSGLSISFSGGSPNQLERESSVELYFDLIVSEVEVMSELVVGVKKDAQSEVEIVSRLPVTQDGNGFYYVSDQCIYNTGIIKYITSFSRGEIKEKGTLIFYATDKSGVQSEIISYNLNQ